MEPKEHYTNLSRRFFPSALEQRFFVLYRRVFSIHEIENEKLVQIAFGALLFSVFMGLSRWFYSHAISVSSYVDNNYSCWPYFQDCGKWYFLQALPEGYTQSIFFMALFAVMTVIAYFIYHKEWVLAHMLMVLVWITKFTILFVLTQNLAANYDYYDTVLLDRKSVV